MSRLKDWDWDKMDHRSRLRIPLKMLISAIAAAVMITPIAAQTSFDLQSELDAKREEASLVGMGAIIMTTDGDILGEAVSGKRVSGSDDPVALDDAWHIGSNTKMLTALLYGLLVEEGHLHWGATLPELFPDLADTMHPDWKDVTIEHLLSHRSGLHANPPWTWFETSRHDQRSLSEQRYELVKKALEAPPPNPVGEYLYSNYGFMVAGSAIERNATGKYDDQSDQYEDIFRRTLLTGNYADPGHAWGFGVPQDGAQGHSVKLFVMTVPAGTKPDADNPAALGPAGTAYVPMEQHALMLTRFLKDDDLPEDLKTHILSGWPDDNSTYGLGMGRKDTQTAGMMYGHMGSNTVWVSNVLMAPELDLVIIVNTNQGDAAARSAVNEFAQEILLAFVDTESGK